MADKENAASASGEESGEESEKKVARELKKAEKNAAKELEKAEKNAAKAKKLAAREIERQERQSAKLAEMQESVNDATLRFLAKMFRSNPTIRSKCKIVQRKGKSPFKPTKNAHLAVRVK